MTTQTLSPQLFSPAKSNGTVAEAAVARAAQEVQAAMVIAKKFPRNETEAFNRILASCSRKTLAECAVYSYPRGGTAVSGPSIRLAECIAQNWGNMDFGVVELDQRNGESQVMAYAWDLETNTRQTKIFTVKHERRVGKGENFRIDELTDPRDIYEMVANNGARRLRACILGVVPGDVVDAAVEACEKTIQAKDAKIPLIDKIRTLPGFFDRFGVTIEMLESKLGHTLDTATSKEYGEMVKIFNALKDNMAKVADFFPAQPAKPEFSTESADDGLGPQRNAPEVPGPEKARVEPEPPKRGPGRPVQNFVKAIRGLLQLKGHTEAELLTFCRNTEKLDDSLSNLEEAFMVDEPGVRWIHDNWVTVDRELTRLKAEKVL